MRVSIGVFAHNEELRIGLALRAIATQMKRAEVEYELLVFSCGSTDRTVEVARREVAHLPCAKVIANPVRRGKLSAIQEFGHLARGQVAVICSADVVPGPEAVLAAICRVAKAPAPVMVGMRVMTEPRNPARLVDGLSQVLWGIHHHAAVRDPKLGEMVVLPTSVVRKVESVGVHCDEVVLEVLTRDAGGELVYLPNRVVFNRAVPTLRAFLRQRRRIHCQHLRARWTLKYRVATSRPKTIAAAVAASVASHQGSRARYLALLIVLVLFESAARLLGRVDAARGRSYHTWAHSRSEVR